jgi:hypothetical protein
VRSEVQTPISQKRECTGIKYINKTHHDLTQNVNKLKNASIMQRKTDKPNISK